MDADIDRYRELQGSVALVTGSARNIGMAIALELARAGANVIVNARSDRAAAEEVAEAVRALGAKAQVAIADITEEAQVAKMIGDAEAAFGGIDILVNNAAVRSNQSFDTLTFAEWERLRAVACDGALRVSLGCVPHMIRRGRGAIVGIHGMSSYLAGPNGAHKSAVKDAMAGLHRGMARDLGPHGVRVNVAVVGRFSTERAGSSGELTSQNQTAEIPLGRKGVPQDMANLVRFLVGPYASYISGQTIHLNGGAYMPH